MSALAQRRTAAAAAIMMLFAVLQYVLFAVNPQAAGAAGATNYSIYEFVFANGTVVSGNTFDDGGGLNADVTIPGLGERTMHVSCSDIFGNGPDGGYADSGLFPQISDGPGWQVASYTIERWKEQNGSHEFHKLCGETFIPGSITVKKIADDGSEAFVFSLEGDIAATPTGTASTFGPVASDGVLGDNTDSHAWIDLDAGTYELSEVLSAAQLAAGWEFVSATCDDGSSVVAIDLVGNEDITCTFTNELPAPPPPTPVTVVVSGTCVVTDGGNFARVSVDDIDPDGDVTVTIGGTAVAENGSADLALDTAHAVVVASPSGDFAPSANVASINVSSATCDVPPPPPTPVTVVVSGTCVTGQDGAANGFLAVSISPDSGATVVVNATSYSVSTSNISVAAPGVYNWEATAAVDHELDSAATGSVVIDDCSEVPPPEVVCPIPDIEGVIARQLNKGGYIYADRDADDADTGPFALALAAGVYDVYLTSWDNHTGRPIDSTQTQEQYFVRGWFDGAIVWESASIDDLPDDQDLLTQLVNAGVTIPELDEVGAVHTAFYNEIANSHQPVCVVFVPVAGPTTTTSTTTPTTTTTPPTTNPKSALGDYVWFDADEDGAQDADEEPVPGALVKLLSPAGNVLATDVTDENGKYLFTGLDAGNYRVEVCLAGSTFTVSRAFGVADDQNSDVDGVGDGCGRTALISLPAGVTDLTWDAGIVVDVLGIQIEPTTTTTVVGSTTTIEPVTVGTLPFTGMDSEGIIWMAVASLLAGVAVLGAGRVPGRRKADATVTYSSWTNS